MLQDSPTPLAPHEMAAPGEQRSFLSGSGSAPAPAQCLAHRRTWASICQMNRRPLLALSPPPVAFSPSDLISPLSVFPGLHGSSLRCCLPLWLSFCLKISGPIFDHLPSVLLTCNWSPLPSLPYLCSSLTFRKSLHHFIPSLKSSSGSTPHLE